MMPVSELRLDPLVPIPDHVVVQHVDEPVHRNAREAALVEELLLETAEELLRGRVVYLEVQHPCLSCKFSSSSANASAGVR